MKNKGFIESGVLLVLTTIVATSIGTGFLFTGGNLAGSGFITVSSLLTAYSQLPHVKGEFREKKAVQLCKEEYRGMVVSNCEETVKAMTQEERLNYIKDDIETPQYPMRERLGG